MQLEQKINDRISIIRLVDSRAQEDLSFEDELGKESLDCMQVETFDLLKVLLLDNPVAQGQAFKYFDQLISIKGLN